ncbi:hypothetical protein NDU88_001227 [Pleurodeles waltl]|uniref:Uncharacterized protein n=1 Tax=Pleurodeles waltl TaxID=8319 RepID=A0AAV7PAJ1_PLEWA|nr:hypothetical protein NDU88_001227 [Pleurodeles waltl]
MEAGAEWRESTSGDSSAHGEGERVTGSRSGGGAGSGNSGEVAIGGPLQVRRQGEEEVREMSQLGCWRVKTPPCPTLTLPSGSRVAGGSSGLRPWRPSEVAEWPPERPDTGGMEVAEENTHIGSRPFLASIEGESHSEGTSW